VNILIVTPAPPRSRSGNRVTALRWSRMLRELGHTVRIAEAYHRQRCDLLIALHARRSFPSIRDFRNIHPAKPLVLALTGTDLYGDIHSDADAATALELADRLIVLQPYGVDELPPRHRASARVIFQSVMPPPALENTSASGRQNWFDACVLGHLRPVKDPFRAAAAARLLPASSRIRILHAGGVLESEMAAQARAEHTGNPRYHWLGELPRWRALRLLAKSRLLILSSQMEGGANVVGEALACGTPVLSSRISGSVGLLGPGYAGYFPYADTQALAELLQRAETDAAFYAQLRRACMDRSGLVDPQRERDSLLDLLRECEEIADEA
jgi:putative glycosyltransferase (TIGR04348 family)